MSYAWREGFFRSARKSDTEVLHSTQTLQCVRKPSASGISPYMKCSRKTTPQRLVVFSHRTARSTSSVWVMAGVSFREARVDYSSTGPLVNFFFDRIWKYGFFGFVTVACAIIAV